MFFLENVLLTWLLDKRLYKTLELNENKEKKILKLKNHFFYLDL